MIYKKYSVIAWGKLKSFADFIIDNLSWRDAVKLFVMMVYRSDYYSVYIREEKRESGCSTSVSSPVCGHDKADYVKWIEKQYGGYGHHTDANKERDGSIFWIHDCYKNKFNNTVERLKHA